MFKRVLDYLGYGSTIWAILPGSWQSALAAGAALVTGILGYETGGLFYAVLGAGAMFAFVMAGAYYSILLNRQTSVFEGLSISNVDIHNFFQKSDDPRTIQAITLLAGIKNHCERPMYYRLRKSMCSIADRINQNAGIERTTGILPPGEPGQITFSTLQNIPLPPPGAQPPKGRIELEIEYGSAADNLHYLMICEIEPVISIIIHKSTGAMIPSLHSTLKSIRHERF